MRTFMILFCLHPRVLRALITFCVPLSCIACLYRERHAIYHESHAHTLLWLSQSCIGCPNRALGGYIVLCLSLSCIAYPYPGGLASWYFSRSRYFLGLKVQNKHLWYYFRENLLIFDASAMVSCFLMLRMFLSVLLMMKSYFHRYFWRVWNLAIQSPTCPYRAVSALIGYLYLFRPSFCSRNCGGNGLMSCCW